jgi:hypothetical protein
MQARLVEIKENKNFCHWVSILLKQVSQRILSCIQ